MQFKWGYAARKVKVFLMDQYISFLFKKQSIKGNFVFVTGADSTHFQSVKQFIQSFLKFEKEARLVFYDLGLSNDEALEFKEKFPEVVFETFDYSQYPDFFDIKSNAGEYAWKPVIIWETLSRYQCYVIWMDAGNLIKEKLNNLKKYMCITGYFWHHAVGSIKEWTHEGTLSYLDVPKEFYRYNNLSAAAVGFDYHNRKARELANRWKECALIKECIAPEGSNRDNHRQDQAVFTILAYKMALTGGIRLKKAGFLIHQDIDEGIEVEID